MVVAVVTVGLLVDRAAAQQQILRQDEWKRGYHGLRLVCETLGMQVEDDLDTWQQQPVEQTLLIVLGSARHSPVDVEEHLEEGGAVLVASDGSFKLPRLEIRFDGSRRTVISRRDAFGGYMDCPIVTEFQSSHPVVRGINRIVTNRPGLLRGDRRPDPRVGRVRSIAWLPRLRHIAGARPFLAVAENRAGGRGLLMSDQSVLANQMLVHGDNAALLFQMLRWLRDGSRRHVLIISGGEIISPIDPASIELLGPRPSRRQIMEALQQLPPDLLVDFANAVITTLEDEGIGNQLITSSIDRVSRRNYTRFLFLLGVAVLGFLALLGLFSRQLRPDRPTCEDTLRRKSKRQRLAAERKLAAETLLDRFCFQVARRSLSQWSTFPQGIVFGQSVPAHRGLKRRMRQLKRHMGRKRPGYWTQGRLLQLETEVDTWNQLHADGSLQFTQVPA